MKTCRDCNSIFSISALESGLHKKIGVPSPNICPECRQRRRLAWRNERALYRRTCNFTGKPVISFYQPSAPYKVYAQDEWWKDHWDAADYGREFDFGRSFFDQFAELLNVVPQMSMVISHGENSDYSPYSVSYKNCYMNVSGVVGQDIHYSYWTNDSRDCMDCYACMHCELCYECIKCVRTYNAIYCRDLKNSVDMAYCSDCIGCSNCIGCCNLRNKKHHVFNKEVSPEAFAIIDCDIRASRTSLEQMRAKVEAHGLDYPRLALQLVNTENCTGDYLVNCRNAEQSFFSENLEDCAYCWNIPGVGAKDSLDINYSPNVELEYNCLSTLNAYHCIADVFCWDARDVYHSFQCFYCNDCLGCIGLKHQRYCILNKQYSPAEYEKLRAKIIAHMTKTGEWGEFFPPALSPFSYNETIAQDFFPLAKDQVLEHGWKWSDYEAPPPKVGRVISGADLPERSAEIPADITEHAILCSKSKRPFRVVEAEVRFYRKQNLPLPKLHPEERYRSRLRQINPRRLWQRNCARCKHQIDTTYAPNRAERVLCESCYLEEMC